MGAEGFGGFERFCFFVPMLLGVSAPAVRVWTGHRNPARPFEVITDLAQALGAVWLLIVFPFDFAHLTDTLPEGIRFLLSWVTDGVGKVIFLLEILFMPIAAVVSGMKYLSFRREPRRVY